MNRYSLDTKQLIDELKGYGKLKYLLTTYHFIAVIKLNECEK